MSPCSHQFKRSSDVQDEQIPLVPGTRELYLSTPHHKDSLRDIIFKQMISLPAPLHLVNLLREEELITLSFQTGGNLPLCGLQAGVVSKHIYAAKR